MNASAKQGDLHKHNNHQCRWEKFAVAQPSNWHCNDSQPQGQAFTATCGRIGKEVVYHPAAGCVQPRIHFKKKQFQRCSCTSDARCDGGWHMQLHKQTPM
jgi:hypothetical protein